MRTDRMRPGVLKRVEQSMALALLLAARAAEAEPCLRYEPAVVQLEGRLTRQVFAGRPNFESVAQGDEPEPYWVLRLAKPACVLASPTDELNEAEDGVESLQLFIHDYDRWRPLLGTRVRVSGTLTHAASPHHHTAVLVQVSSMKPVRSGVRRPRRAIAAGRSDSPHWAGTGRAVAHARSVSILQTVSGREEVVDETSTVEGNRDLGPAHMQRRVARGSRVDCGAAAAGGAGGGAGRCRR